MAINLIPYTTRFADALGVMCSERPSVELVNSWITGESDELQEWALNHSRLDWSQGIAVIDAASVLAEQPEEGRPEYLTESGERVARHLAEMGSITMALKRSKWRVVKLPEGLYEWEILEFMNSQLGVLVNRSELKLADGYRFAA